MANLYANENFPLQVVEALRRLGHDCDRWHGRHKVSEPAGRVQDEHGDAGRKHQRKDEEAQVRGQLVVEPLVPAEDGLQDAPGQLQRRPEQRRDPAEGRPDQRGCPAEHIPGDVEPDAATSRRYALAFPAITPSGSVSLSASMAKRTRPSSSIAGSLLQGTRFGWLKVPYWITTGASQTGRFSSESWRRTEPLALLSSWVRGERRFLPS